MIRVSRLSIAVFAALAACSRDDTPDGSAADIPTQTPAASARDVVVADAYQVGAPVRSVDFWAHPNVSFASLIIVGTPTGLIGLNFETGEEVARLDGFAADDLAVGYDGVNGYVVAIDAEAADLHIVDVDNNERTFSRRMVHEVEGSRLCLSDGADDVIFVVNGRNLEGYALSRDGVEGPIPDAVMNGMVDCVARGDEPGALVLTANGAFNVDGADKSPAVEPDALAMILKRPGDAAGDARPAGFVLTLDTANASVRVATESELNDLGAIRFGASFDAEAVDSASALGAGFGNYGGVFRDGVVALGEESGRIALAPWSGVANALGLELGASVNPRKVYPATDDVRAIEIDLVEP